MEKYQCIEFKNEVICLESNAFYELIEQVVDRMMEQKKEKKKWLLANKAMKLLNVTLKTMLKKLKNECHICFSIYLICRSKDEIFTISLLLACQGVE